MDSGHSGVLLGLHCIGKIEQFLLQMSPIGMISDRALDSQTGKESPSFDKPDLLPARVITYLMGCPHASRSGLWQGHGKALPGLPQG